MDARKTAWDRLMTYRFEDADSDRLSIETIDALTYARDMLAAQQARIEKLTQQEYAALEELGKERRRIEALEKEQSAWRKFTDEANRTLEAADKKIATLQARIEALESDVAFYKQRCDELQEIQMRMRDPERQMVCDILANGLPRDKAGIGEYDDQQARIEALEKGLQSVAQLIEESSGVSGLHMNGDVAPWSDLRAGGRFEEWLVDFDAALQESTK